MKHPKRLLMIVLVFILLLVGGAILARHAYNQDLGPVSADQTSQLITIDSGSTSKQIGNQLAAAKLIRSAWAFELYVHSKEVADKLQAGTYALSPSEGTPAIINTLIKGHVQTKLVTILPGRRIDQVRADLINDGFSPASVDKALQPSQYSDIATLAYKPPSVTTLEGLLYPDSFQKTADTDPSAIIRQSLQEMATQLTPDMQAAFAQQGLTTYQGIVLASMLEKEVSRSSDRAQASQVFLKRLKTDMMLGSDVTAIYGAIAAGQNDLSQGQMLQYDSPYNTLLNKGLPPGPISSVSASSLQAAAHPANTDWLYFVAGDDGTTYFSTNLQDHEALTQKYCHKLCSQ